MTRSRNELKRLIGGALGELEADLIVTGGKLINVYSGEILTGFEIAALDGRICYLGPSAERNRGARTEIVDAAGAYIAPGFIDGHTHIGHYARPFENLQSFVPRGTTALVASSDEFSSVFGRRGHDLFLDEVARHPLRGYAPARHSPMARSPKLWRTRACSAWARWSPGSGSPRATKKFSAGSKWRTPSGK